MKVHLIVFKIDRFNHSIYSIHFNTYCHYSIDSNIFCLQVDRSLLHDTCVCDMCVDEKYFVRVMKHLLMIQ